MVTEMRGILKGRVQGVGLRDFIVSAAEELQLTGFVRNLADGTVEVLAQGYPDALRIFATRLQTGSVLSQIQNAAFDMHTVSVLYDEFKRL